ncbi:MAG: InlB B-repeat-containing protein, partial [Bacilli bacterium]|nr:InlB B-repeat-containing protein [Bacilli bacterium]
MTIGENGNWIIDGADSGVKAQGPKGDQGDPGQDGRGIASIEKTSSEGLVDTYTIVYTDGSTSTFVVNNGQQGAQGIQGQPGQDGHTPTVTIGENGNWFIDGADSGVKAQGPKGDQGDPGQDGRGVVSIEKTASEGLTDTYTITYTDGTASTFVVTNGQDGQQGAPGIQGQPGQDGHTPSITIGENGNWFIDGVDSGVSCRGADGQQGEKGNDGVSIVTVLLTSSDGLTDTYTIYYSDENTSTFTVKNGQNGIDGIQGNPGADGHSPVVSIVDGYWSIDGVSTGVTAVGEEGKTPYVGDNGNWWIGEEDTGILSRGNSICAFMFDPEGSAEADSLALGDLWLNTMTGDLFVKRDGAWQRIGNLKGLNGLDGHTPYIDGGYWYIAGENTGILAQGPKGDQGDPGEKGEDGLTPYIGANGHWWIGEDDTGFVAVGQDGEDGQDGVSIVDCYCAEVTDEGALYRLEFSDGQDFDFFIPKGENGLTPTVTINEQGHWVINGEDTLVNATGEQGNSITGITLERQSETDSTYRISFSDGTSTFFTVNHGRNGQDGVSIVDIRLTSSEGLVDTYTIYYSDESTSTFTVTNGTQGAQGIQGEPGQDGHTPTIRIGENGDWIIDDVDTGILAKGPKGDPGEPGKDGKSAYQIYCEVYGYSGTEEQWLHDLVNGLLADANVHTVTFDTGDGGSVVDPQVVRDGGKAVRPANPSRPGYIFKDWVDEYGEHWAFNGFSITEDITLYAKWEVDTYALAFPSFYDDSSDDYAYRSLSRYYLAVRDMDNYNYWSEKAYQNGYIDDESIIKEGNK